MKLKTRDFGEIEIKESDIITFAGPIFGFEEYRRFAFLYQEDVSEVFVWLQSVEDPQLCFILVQPGHVLGQYSPQTPSETEELLGEGEYMCWLLTSLREPPEESTVNLKSPLVVNPASHKAAQLLLEGELPIRHPLFRKKEEPEC